VLQFYVPELIDRTRLPENTAPVGIGEEAHKGPRQSVA
jgi:hypothetical protein